MTIIHTPPTASRSVIPAGPAEYDVHIVGIDGLPRLDLYSGSTPVSSITISDGDPQDMLATAEALLAGVQEMRDHLQHLVDLAGGAR
ncbi:hypothetical protein [Marinactinospora rubrisoli]|uniref:Uncharacterized protein n=1 Tax=Marinactinospora rubrisoli TaxID=2715399 RepID=A0ABW2KN25_9ACTN